jgi:hypothetical protein
LKFDGKVILGPALLLANFSHLRADDIQLCRMFLDVCTLAIAESARWKLYRTLLKTKSRFCLP